MATVKTLKRIGTIPAGSLVRDVADSLARDWVERGGAEYVREEVPQAPARTMTPAPRRK